MNEEPVAFERLTVNMTERSMRALELAAQQTGLSKTDCLNRAIQVYSYLEQEMAADQILLLRDSNNNETHIVRWE